MIGVGDLSWLWRATWAHECCGGPPGPVSVVEGLGWLRGEGIGVEGLGWVWMERDWCGGTGMAVEGHWLVRRNFDGC